MTRFARAKGSKASNEKKPEEATSWSEMKRSMLSKKSKEPEKEPEKITKNENVQKQTEWASLGDDGLSGCSLLKQNAVKKNKKEKAKAEGKKSKKENKEKGKGKKDKEESKVIGSKKKRKNKTSDPVTVTSSCESEEMKKKQKVIPQEREIKVKKKRKKEDSEEASPKKRKKVMKQNEISQRKESGERYKKKKERKLGGGRQQFRENWNNQAKGKRKFWDSSNEVSSAVEEVIINGEKIKIVKFQGFYVTLEDAERLKNLRKEMMKEGIPREKLESAIKLERRRAEKALSRLKKFVCFHCRSHGHLLSDCPELKETETTGTGICYKCGSGEHSANDCKVERGSRFQFAECFICKEQGHIARQCPDNPRGLYPRGGACRECGDVTHLRKDCPKVVEQKEHEALTVGVRDERSLEGLEEELIQRVTKKGVEDTKKKKTKVRF